MYIIHRFSFFFFFAVLLNFIFWFSLKSTLRQRHRCNATNNHNNNLDMSLSYHGLILSEDTFLIYSLQDTPLLAFFKAVESNHYSNMSPKYDKKILIKKITSYTARAVTESTVNLTALNINVSVGFTILTQSQWHSNGFMPKNVWYSWKTVWTKCLVKRPALCQSIIRRKWQQIAPGTRFDYMLLDTAICNCPPQSLMNCEGALTTSSPQRLASCVWLIFRKLTNL